MRADLGELSAKYESNGDPGCVSNTEGDLGGKSYGCYQLSLNMGSVQSYVDWCIDYSDDWFSTELTKYPVGSEEFDDVWRILGNKFPEQFAESQHTYIGVTYYIPAVEALKEAMYDVEKHSHAMQDVVWSRAVQYGVGNIVEMFEAACTNWLDYPNLSYVDDKYFDAQMISAVYGICSSPEWTSGSPSLRYGLCRRFNEECLEALEMLDEEGLFPNYEEEGEI